MFLSILVSAPAAPRYFAPSVLRPGALNEVYVWDEDPVAPFSIEIRRAGVEKTLLIVRGFSVDRPLSVAGQDNRPFHWSAALVSPDALAKPGPVSLRFIAADKRILAELNSEILPREFRTEVIPLDRVMTQLRAKPDRRKDMEAVAIWAVYEKFEAQFTWFGGRFSLPVSPQFGTSAYFGDTRKYLYSDGTADTDYHRGTDFAVPIGTPVLAPADGIVALVADRMLTGQTVVLEHAPGLYSIYFHLSKALVKEGQRVISGDLIALSGASGLVTGPHLHWEIRSQGVPVDPLEVVTGELLDTTRVSAVVSSSERTSH